MTLRTWSVALITTCISSTWPGALAQQPAQQPAKPSAASPVSGFVGSNPCRACHPDVWARFYKNPHFKSIASGKEPPERTGCESCHGPGKAHIERTAARPPSSLSRNWSSARFSTTACAATVKRSAAQIFDGPRTRSTASCARIATPSTSRRHRNSSWLRSSRTFVIPATRRSAPSSPCPSSTASTKASCRARTATIRTDRSRRRGAWHPGRAWWNRRWGTKSPA